MFETWILNSFLMDANSNLRYHKLYYTLPSDAFKNEGNVYKKE